MSDDFNDDGMDEPSRGGANMMLPVATALVALLVGGGLGALGVAAWWRASPPDVEEKIVQRDLTDAEIESLCNPFVTDTLAVLTEAQAKVSDLESQVELKEAKVVELEAEMKRRGAAGKKLWDELQAAKAEVETLREQLAVAIEEKEAALVELEKTVEQLRATEDELAETQGKLSVAEGDVLDNRWKGFVQNAQLEICEKGRRKKMGRCRESVTAALNPELEAKFRHCVKSGQAVPGFFEVGKDMEELPSYSQYLNEEERALKGWYVTFCDPTLPEAEDFTEALQAIQVNEDRGEAGEAAGGAVDDLLEKMEDKAEDIVDQ